MTTVRSRSLVDRLDRATAACTSLDALARVVFDVTAHAVPFAFACLATIDPASGMITRAVKSSELPMGDEDFAASEYGTPDINKFAEIAQRPVPIGVLSIDTDGDPQRCLRLRAYMTPQFGFTDEIRMACRSRGATWGGLGIYRATGEPMFTRRDADVLVDVHELIARRLQQILFGAPAAGGAVSGAAILVVDSADRVSDLTASVEDRIAELGGWDRDSLPANVLSVVASARSTGEPAHSRVPTIDGHWLALQAMPLTSTDGARSVVVTIDQAPPSAVGQMTLAARGLTGREQDVAQLVLQGASTKDIAAALFLSPHTVQDHLKAIFAKLEVSSRREMIARLVVPR